MPTEETGTIPGRERGFRPGGQIGCLLVARAPEGAFRDRRIAVVGKLGFGRSDDCTVRINDQKVSRRQFEVAAAANEVVVEDSGSKNGTHVNGRLIRGPRRLDDGDVIRAGRSLLVFHGNARGLLDHEPVDTLGFVGPFHAPLLIGELVEAVGSGRNLLLAGPTGSGKELAARAVGRLAGRPMTVQNAARFSTEDEAKSSLFGVGPKVFSEVKERAGYIEQAHGGVLFLDEAHVLPERVQKALLRVIEDGKLARIGESAEREVDVRFVLASNEPGPHHGLARDLLARLRLVRIPGLGDRRADIPAIFDHLLEREMTAAGVAGLPLKALLSVVHYESLILDGFPDDNVRGLLDIANRIASRAGAGVDPIDAVADVFAERYGSYYRTTLDEASDVVGPLTGTIEVPRSVAMDIRTLVAQAFRRLGSNVTAIKDHLRSEGIDISWKRVARIMDELGLPRNRRDR